MGSTIIDVTGLPHADTVFSNPYGIRAGDGWLLGYITGGVWCGTALEEGGATCVSNRGTPKIQYTFCTCLVSGIRLMSWVLSSHPSLQTASLPTVPIAV